MVHDNYDAAPAAPIATAPVAPIATPVAPIATTPVAPIATALRARWRGIDPVAKAKAKAKAKGKGKQLVVNRRLVQQATAAVSLHRDPSEVQHWGQCTICCFGMSPSQSRLTLECAHTFHRNCISEWVRTSGKSWDDCCPQCGMVAPAQDPDIIRAMAASRLLMTEGNEGRCFILFIAGLDGASSPDWEYPGCLPDWRSSQIGFVLPDCCPPDCRQISASARLPDIAILLSARLPPDWDLGQIARYCQIAVRQIAARLLRLRSSKCCCCCLFLLILFHVSNNCVGDRRADTCHVR